MRVILLGAMLVLLVACENPDAAAIGTPGGDPTGVEVEVTLTEFEIQMEEVTLAPGPTTFVVTNEGSVEHSFSLIGQSIDTGFDEPLQPGETLTLTTSLQPGVYDIFCPVGNHESEGMELSIQVIGPDVP